MEGTIIKVNTDKGWCFIERRGDNDVFAHASAFAEDILPFDAQLEERRVRFEIEHDEKGRDRAVRVRPI